MSPCQATIHTPMHIGKESSSTKWERQNECNAGGGGGRKRAIDGWMEVTELQTIPLVPSRRRRMNGGRNNCWPTTPPPPDDKG